MAARLDLDIRRGCIACDWDHGAAQVVLFSDQVTEEDGRRYEHPHFLEHHGLVIADFAQSVLHGTSPSADAIDSLGESWTALAAYKAQESGQWEQVYPAGFWRQQRGTTGKL